MNFKFVLLIFSFSIFSACKDLSFADEDFITPENKPPQETPILKNESKNNLQKLEEETTVLSEDLELLENKIIQNKKIILDMAKIQTNEHDLTIIAEEFISHHSFIKNFKEGQTAEEKEEGKSGGLILIKAKTAKGSLGLILSGENGGYVPQRKLSIRAEFNLSGRSGENGFNAVYDTWCSDFYIPTIFGRLVLDRNCWNECRIRPTKGQNGGKGRQGYPGYDGKRGGDSGSFHLQAFNLSDFYLTTIKKTVGLGSRGGKGSFGGYGGARGKNGRDPENLCSSNLPRPKRGKRGRTGLRGKDGENGREGAVCLENIKNQNQQFQEISETKKEPLEKNKNQPETKKTKIICKENESGSACREVLVEDKPVQNLNQRENVVCY